MTDQEMIILFFALRLIEGSLVFLTVLTAAMTAEGGQ